MDRRHVHHGVEAQTFSRDIDGLPEAVSSEAVLLTDGDRHEIRIVPVRKRLGEHEVRMLAYNGSIPGPSLRVRQGSEVTVHVRNEGDLEATVHWHGLRLENRFDGVPLDTQQPIPVGGSFTYRLQFPDEGIYWYHPHVREDYAQEMGLYGTILVEPEDPGYWPPANRELVVTLDDILLEDGRVAPFLRHGSSHTAMGRYGNVLLVAGEPELEIAALQDEIVRFFFVNTANARVFNVRMPGGRMKLVGGDSGRVEREEPVDEVLLAPSERAVVDVLFATPGAFPIEHRTPERTYRLGRVHVAPDPAGVAGPEVFDRMRRFPVLEAEREAIAADFARPPDKILSLVGEMAMQHSAMSMPQEDTPTGHGGPHADAGLPHGDARGSAHGATDGAGAASSDDDGLEWEDTMPEMNAMSTGENMRWSIVDRATGAANHDIFWTLRRGDRVKIRIVNEPDSDHPMQHPFHVHGQRFLVLARGGSVERNLVWKDTVLVRTGETVDILLDASNPGRWMAHCHIAEHAESGMMFSFEVK